jgi:hypothetical protein
VAYRLARIAALALLTIWVAVSSTTSVSGQQPDTPLPEPGFQHDRAYFGLLPFEHIFFGGIEIDEPGNARRSRQHVWINSRTCRTPLEHALIAAVAVVVARVQHTRIVDYTPFFTSEIDSCVEDFVGRVKIRGPFIDILAAADHFNRNLFSVTAIPTRPSNGD